MNTNIESHGGSFVLTDIRRIPHRSQSRKRIENFQLVLRIPPELVDRLNAASRANYRSRTAEIEARLWESFEGESIDEHGVIVRRVAGSIK